MTFNRRTALVAGGAALGLGLLQGARALAFGGAMLRWRQGQLVQGGWALGQADLSQVKSLLLDGIELPMTADGGFFIAFDRDSAPQVKLTARLAGGLGLDQSLTIAPRAWHIENIDAPFHPPAMPDAEFARLRAIDMAQINAARAQSTQANGWQQSFQWPARGRISGLFGSQRIYRGTAGSYHSGIDIALPAGAPYAAPADGVVVLAADHPFTLEGNLLMVDHGMGLTSAFLHSSALLVGVGDKVAKDQPIGRVGMTGRATGPHLHWSLRWHEARLDPMLFAGSMG